MTDLRHDRIFPLKHLHAYPSSPWLDATFYLPGDRFGATAGDRRVWAKVPASTPVIRIDDVKLRARRVCDGPPRWIDYGTAALPARFCQLRLSGMTVPECAESHLLIAARADFSPEGCTVEQAERKLWGLARCDAGATTLHPARLEVGRPCRFTVRYTAGPRGLPAGAMVRFAVPKAFARPQTDDVGADGFVSAAGGGAVVAAVEGSVESHTFHDIVCRLDAALPAGEGFELRYRADWTYIYPSVFGEVDRRYWYVRVPPLSAAAAVAADAPFVSLAEGNGHVFELIAGPAERLLLWLPGRRRRGQPLALRGLFTDRYRNVPPRGPIDADVELALIGPERIALPSPAGHFTARHRFEIALGDLAEGVWRAVARRGGQEIARSNPLEVVAGGGGKEPIWWGEIHGHTEMSDGCGGYGELYRHARDEGAMDFAAAADHACYFCDNQWQWMQDVTNSFDDPGRFVTLVGYEWAGRQSHRNVYTSRRRLELFRGMYGPTSSIETVWRHFHGDEKVVGGPHAPLAHGITWEGHDGDVERFVEIYSMWGASDDPENPLAPLRIKAGNASGTMSANDLLAAGAKLGFTGGGDCHEGHAGLTCEDPAGQGTVTHTFAVGLPYRCGMTAAVADALDRRSLIRAIRRRRTYATTGARILLDFEAGGLPMGSAGAAEAVTCRGQVHAVGPIDRVEIVKDGKVAFSRRGDGADAAIEWRDPDPPVRQHWYYLRVVQADGEMAWSSPVWVGPVE